MINTIAKLAFVLMLASVDSVADPSTANADHEIECESGTIYYLYSEVSLEHLPALY